MNNFRWFRDRYINLDKVLYFRVEKFRSGEWIVEMYFAEDFFLKADEFRSENEAQAYISHVIEGNGIFGFEPPSAEDPETAPLDEFISIDSFIAMYEDTCGGSLSRSMVIKRIRAHEIAAARLDGHWAIRKEYAVAYLRSLQNAAQSAP